MKSLTAFPEGMLKHSPPMDHFVVASVHLQTKCGTLSTLPPKRWINWANWGVGGTMSLGLTMRLSICASLLSSIVGRVGTSTGSKTVTAGGGFGVLSRSSAVSV